MKMEVNISRLEEIIGNDAEMKKTLLGMFVNSCEKNITTLKNTLSKDSTSAPTSWKDSVHDLKGAAYNLGFEEMGDYCRDIESKELTESEKLEAIETFIGAKNGVSDLLKDL